MFTFCVLKITLWVEKTDIGRFIQKSPGFLVGI